MTREVSAVLPDPAPAAVPYRPGLHVLATFAAPAATLTDLERCRAFFAALVGRHGLSEVGAAYHAFDSGGFTAVLALTESHLSVHTWPEHGLATFDVFLSNFRQDNRPTARAVYADTLAFFGGRELHHQEVLR